MVSRRGIAVSVTRIIPVLYSPPTASTASDGDDRLAEVDAGEADLRRVAPAGALDRHAWPRAAAAAPTTTVSATEPAAATHVLASGAELGPLGMQRSQRPACRAAAQPDNAAERTRRGAAHASLRRSRQAATASATAAQAHSTASPAHGASG